MPPSAPECGKPQGAAIEPLRALIAGSPDAIALARDGRIVFVNPALAQLFGYADASQLSGLSTLDLVAPEGQDVMMEPSRRRSAGAAVPPVFRSRGLRRDGSTFALEISVVAVGPGDAEWTLAIARNVEHEASGPQLESRGEDFYRAIFDVNTAVKLLIAPTMGRIVDANPAAAEFYGWPLDVLKTMRISDINLLTSDEVKAEMEAARLGKRRYFRFRHRTASGDVRHVEVHSSPIQIEGEQLLFSVIHDVTERDALEEQLHQSQRLEIVGQLAGGVAHDFNNLLTVMLTAAELLRRRLPAGSGLQQHVDDLQHAGRRAADLTRDLLAFSRRQRVQVTLVDVNRVVLQMQGLLQRTLGGSIEVDTRLAPALPTTRVDPGQLEHVVMNLALNARDAMPNGGHLLLQTERAVGADDVPHGIPAGDWVVLCVVDQGRGMDEPTRTHIFEPFFTTKEPGKGTGLGLSTVYGIVTESGGHITVRSEPGRGSVFKVFLPATHATRSMTPEPRREAASSRRGLVLLVDDDDAVRGALARALANAGFEVDQARSADEALASARLAAIDILVTDVVMPGRSGVDLAMEVLARRPGLPVLLISGELRQNDPARLPPHVRFRQKPFTGQDLADTIASILEEQPGATR